MRVCKLRAFPITVIDPVSPKSDSLVSLLIRQLNNSNVGWELVARKLQLQNDLRLQLCYKLIDDNYN